MNPIAALTLFLLVPLGLLAQDPNLVPGNIDFTRSLAERNHLAVDVSVQFEADQYFRYRFERYPAMKKIVMDAGTVYIQPEGKGWLESEDGGETGFSVKPGWAAQLEAYAKLAQSPLVKGRSQDSSGGKIVWKLVSQQKKGDVESFTFECSPEKANPERQYPRCTFLKGPNDKDGQLLIEHCSGQMNYGDKLVPVEFHLGIETVKPEGSVKIEKAEVPGQAEEKRK